MKQPQWADRFKENVNANQQFYYKDYKEVNAKVDASTAIYQDKPMRFIYQPLLFQPKDTRKFKELSETLVGILRKVIEAYREDASVRKAFGFSTTMEKLILTDPGYTCEFPVARFDIFYNFETQDFKFCELNADGTSSMNEARELANILVDSHVLDEYKKDYKINVDELIDSWIDTVINLYKEAKGEKAKENPTIMIADFENDGIISEFEVFKQRFEEHGYQTIIGDPSELNYNGNHLTLNQQVIDIMYRRATTGRVVEEIHRVTDWINAYVNGDVCVVGGFVSQLIHNKVLFALLYQEGLFNLTEKERKYIKQHIPYTAFMKDLSEDVIKQIKNDKNKYLLKPFDQYAAHGIYVGHNYDGCSWASIVDECLSEDYLVQEFYEVEQLDLCVEENGVLVFKPHRHMIGLFMYAQQFVGTYIRAGQKPIIATHGGESRTVAGFHVEAK